MEPSGSSRRFRRINLLWVLAALLGAAAMRTTATAIHHPEPSRELMAHFATVTAEYARAIAEARLQAAAREVFAPAPPRSPVPATPRAVLGAVALFHVDLLSGKLDMRTAQARGIANPLPDSVLLRSAAAAAHDPADGSLRLHFVSSGSGDEYAVLLSLQRDASGNSVGAYGLVTGASALLAQLFGPGTPPDTTSPLQRSGTSLEVSAGSGPPLFRTPGPLLPYRVTIHPRGALAELAITTGLTAPRGLLLSLHSGSRQQLWLSGLLLLSTTLVIVLAAASSRREALLARARSDFIAGVSHELRMPLAQILLASETLAEEREPDPRVRLSLATSIVREARRLATLVDNVLLVARSGAIALRPALAPVSVAELFTDVGDAVRLAVEDAGQRLEVRALPGLYVLGDRLLLRQALSNLIDNARKYGRPNQTIRLDAAPSAPNGVVLFVEDEGPGVPAELRARLFEPYERLPRDQTSERTGSGLGLAVVAQIARACGGSVRLEDGRIGGTRAVLALQGAAASPVL
jgi:signal transduction histidine kinase